jgi:hypothetical protein
LAGCDLVKGDSTPEAASKTEPAAASIAPAGKDAPVAAAAPAKAEPAAAPTKAPEPEEIDVDELLAAPNAAGIASVELDPAAVAAAPRLGGTAANHAAIKDADWLSLPGGKLEIPNPKAWTRKRDEKSGVLISPTQKVAIMFTSFTDMKEVAAKLDEIGKRSRISKVQWKEPKQVRLGADNLEAVVRGGEVTTENGQRGELLFALIETGAPEKVLAVELRQSEASKEDLDVGTAVLLSVRNKR